MKKVLRLGLAATLVLALLVFGPFSPTQAKKPPEPPSGTLTSLVDDNFPNMVRSDGQGLYVDGEACVVIHAYEGYGFYQLRTVSNSDYCNHNPSRFLNLDFGEGNEWDVDQDGTPEPVESVFARFIARDAFRNDATSTSVTILVLETTYTPQPPDGTVKATTTQDHAWELRYLNPADVEVHSDGSRTITFLVSGDADAELFETAEIVHPKSGKVKTEAVFRGKFNMPFKVIAARK